MKTGAFHWRSVRTPSGIEAESEWSPRSRWWRKHDEQEEEKKKEEQVMEEKWAPVIGFFNYIIYININKNIGLDSKFF